jgi:hypothetical protein
MTTLTPFRLFQVAKYAWARYAPELLPFSKKPSTYNRLKASLQDTTRNRTRNVGFHVEERRSWDVRPPSAESAASTRQLNTASAEPRIATEKRELPPHQLESTEEQRANVSSPPDPNSPMGGPDKKGGISASDMSEIKRLMVDATLFTPDFKPPKNVIVLCHGTLISFRPMT